MKPYLEFKNEIVGLNDVLSTVKMVEKISASNIHMLKSTVAAHISYQTSISDMMGRLLQFMHATDDPLLHVAPDRPTALVLLTGNKGLVGGLNHGLIEELMDTRKDAAVIAVGKKGERYCAEEGIKIAKEFETQKDLPTEAEISEISRFVIEAFLDGTYGRIDIIYPQYVSLTVQTPQRTTFLPFDFTPPENDETLGFPIFGASRKAVFTWLLKRYVEIAFVRVLLEAKLSELSARTVETEQAAEKTRKIIKATQLDFFKTRRRSLTQKQLESFAVHKML